VLAAADCHVCRIEKLGNIDFRDGFVVRCRVVDVDIGREASSNVDSLGEICHTLDVLAVSEIGNWAGNRGCIRAGNTCQHSRSAFSFVQ